MQKLFNKKALILVSVVLLLATMAVTVVAQTRNRDVTSTIRYDMTIRLDGEALTLRDANGNEVQPMSFGGTTYLPLRAIAEILGLDVDWDGATQTVFLSNRHERQLWLADHAQILRLGTSPANNRASIVRGAGNLPQINGPQFNSAVAVEMSTLAGRGTIELDGIYTSLAFESVIFETPRNRNLNFTIVNADTETVLHQMTLTPNTFYNDISFDLYGATRIRIEIPIDGNRGNDGNTLFLLNPLLVG